jgi:hypothetical protein
MIIKGKLLSIVLTQWINGGVWQFWPIGGGHLLPIFLF